jgi:hypothetical protein
VSGRTFHPVKTCLRTPVGVEEQLHSFVTSALDRGMVSFTIRPLCPGERASRVRECLRAGLETTLFSTRGFSVTETSSLNKVLCPIAALLPKDFGLASRLPTLLFIWHTRPFSPEVSSSRNLKRFSWGPERGWHFVSEAATCSLLVNARGVSVQLLHTRLDTCSRRCAGEPGTKLVKVFGAIAVLSAFHFGPLASGKVPPPPSTAG